MVSNRIDVEKTWGSAWLIYKTNLTSILLIILIIYLPFFIIRLVFPYEQIYNHFGYTAYEITKGIIQIIGSLVAVIGFISLVIITESCVNGNELTLRDVFLKACSRWWAFIKSTFLSGIIILLFTLLFIIPGIVRSIQYAFVSYAVSIRDVSGKKALEYSRSVTDGQRWRVFGFYLLLCLLGIGPALVYFYLIYLTDYDKIIVNGALVINYIISPFFTILYGVLFLDLEKQWKKGEMIIEDGNSNPSEQLLSSP